jgi:ATP/maltotriose-dependent transcriptional regulator MalT
MDELLRPKLIIPGTRANHHPRARLVEQLNTELDKKLLLISAPAGFGKTTMAVGWLTEKTYASHN